jgi:uncharacterized protein YbjT (DUF2867 family)
MAIKVILTGATGMVGEGVLLECLENPAVEKVLAVGRRRYGLSHPKLTECVVPDFLDLSGVADQLNGYDACFYCAGISSLGLSEAEYRHITYDLTLNFAGVLAGSNPEMTFCFVSGAQTDSSEQGKVMWARVKGKTENALTRAGFKQVYNFRPGFMKPTAGQRNIRGYYRAIWFAYPLLHAILPAHGCALRDVGLAMIESVLRGYPKQVLEVKDIKILAGAA